MRGHCFSDLRLEVNYDRTSLWKENIVMGSTFVVAPDTILTVYGWK